MTFSPFLLFNNRYKNLIESRKETSSPPIQLNFATGIDLYNANIELENRPNDRKENFDNNNTMAMDLMMRMVSNDKCSPSSSSLDSSHFIGNNHDICNKTSGSSNNCKNNTKLSMKNIHGYCSKNMGEYNNKNINSDDDINNIGTTDLIENMGEKCMMMMMNNCVIIICNINMVKNVFLSLFLLL